MSKITFIERHEPTKLISRNSEQVPEFLYHYTSETSFWSIVEEGVIYQSDNPKAVRHGPGVYLTSIPPGSVTQDLLSNNYGAAKITAGAKATKLRYVFEIKLTSLPHLSHVTADKRDIWVSRSDLRLADIEFTAYDTGDDESLKNQVGTNEGCYDPFGRWHTFEPSPGNFRGLRQEDFPALSGSSSLTSSDESTTRPVDYPEVHTEINGRRRPEPTPEDLGPQPSKSHYDWYDRYYERDNEVQYSYRSWYDQQQIDTYGHDQNASRNVYEEQSQSPYEIQEEYVKEQHFPQLSYMTEKCQDSYQSSTVYNPPRPTVTKPFQPLEERLRNNDDYYSIASNLQNMHLISEPAEEPVQLIRRDSHFLPSDDPPASSWSRTYHEPMPMQPRPYRPRSQRMPSETAPPRIPLPQQQSRHRSPHFPSSVRTVRSGFPY